MTTTVLSGHRRRPRLHLRSRTLSHGRRRLLSISVCAQLVLAAALAVGVFLPGHAVYSSSGLGGSFFIGTCSGVGYLPSPSSASAPTVVAEHTMWAHGGLVLLAVVAIAVLIGWALSRRRTFAADLGVSAVSLATAMAAGVLLVGASLDHLFSRTDSLVGEHTIAVAVLGLLATGLAHLVGAVSLYVRQRRDDERSRPLPMAWAHR